MKIVNNNLFKPLKSFFPFLMALLLIIILSIATIVEKEISQDFVIRHFYGTIWFVVLWFLFIGTTLLVVFKSQKKSLSSFLIHTALGFILCGAVVTWLTGQSGYLHLRLGQQSSFFFDKNYQECHQLPFQLVFEKFTIKNSFASATEDYILKCKLFEKAEVKPVQISVNKPIKCLGYRLLLNSYDDDLSGAVLMVNYDPFGKWIVYAGFLLLVAGMCLWLFSKRKVSQKEKTRLSRKEIIGRISLAVLFSLFTIYLLFWIFAGHRLPLANGMEATLVSLWFMQLITLASSRKYRFMTAVGWGISCVILSLFAFGQVNLEAEALQPVLRSPFLVVHVLCVMFSYALLGLTFLIGLLALIYSKNTTKFTRISKILLAPAMLLLALGVCIGAVWADNSWGAYWSWDPKEVWALITFMVYSFALHEKSLPFLQKEKNYHLFMIVAFLFVLMTFLGVNFLLGGMHSYM